MKTAQLKAAVMEHSILRRFAIIPAFAVALALGAAPAAAQSGPICSKFDAGKDGFGPCTDAPRVTVTTVTDAGGITKDDAYLKVTDLSGASRVCSSDPKYVGNWLKKMNGCGQLCFDFKVFSSGYPPSVITPSFSIVGGTGRATFYAGFQVAIGDTSWHRNICMPVQDGANPPASSGGHWVVTGDSWHNIITNVSMVQLPIDFSSSPSEVVGYDNICMSPGDCGEKPKNEVTGCLKDSKIEVKCNADGTYTLTLSGAGIAGNVITLASQTPGVTISPPQQAWAASTTWTVTGATPGQLVTLAANASKIDGGSVPGADQCCSGVIKITMPECPPPKPPIDLKVEKENTSSGGQGNGFNVWLTNVGAPITFAPGELTVRDVVPSGLTISTQSSPNWTCSPLPATGLVTITCTYNLAGTLGTGAQLTDSLVFAGVLTNKEQPLKNCAIVSIPASVGVDANAGNNDACVTISNPQVGVLIVHKEAEYVGPILLPLQPYPINFNCGSTSGTVNVTPGTPQTIGSIPYGSTCTLNEGTFATLPNLCPPTWTPVWATTYIPSSSIPINAPSTTVTLKNKLTCKAPDVGILNVRKQVDQNSYEMNVSSLTFPASATCSGTSYPLTLSTLAPSTVSLLPLGTVCSVTENVSSLPLLADTCPAGNTPGWTVTTTPATAIIGTTPVTIIVLNKFTCTPTPSGVCPQGTVLRGRECVKVSVCRPPLVPGARRGTCVCPAGTTKKGTACVTQIVCRSPAKLNNRGTACDCPRGMTLKGNSCIEQRAKPRVTPNDVIRVLPGVLGPGGFGGKPRDGGGAGSDSYKPPGVR